MKFRHEIFLTKHANLHTLYAQAFVYHISDYKSIEQKQNTLPYMLHIKNVSKPICRYKSTVFTGA